MILSESYGHSLRLCYCSEEKGTGSGHQTTELSLASERVSGGWGLDVMTNFSFFSTPANQATFTTTPSFVALLRHSGDQ